MLGWALTFLVVALIAAAVGFGGVGGVAATVAQALFALFLTMFIATVIIRKAAGKPPV